MDQKLPEVDQQSKWVLGDKIQECCPSIGEVIRPKGELAVVIGTGLLTVVLG